MSIVTIPPTDWITVIDGYIPVPGPPGPPGGGAADVVWVGPAAPTDPTVELWYDTDAPDGGGGGGGSMSGPTVDTGENYRIIMFSDGTVRAIPFDATTPTVPTGLTLTARVNSVNVTWTAVSGATSYRVYRNPGGLIATPTATHHRDSNVTVSQTYQYTVQAVNAYGLRSPETAIVSTFIDPALNVAPTVEIRAWPTSVALGNRAIIRINATDVDGQALANTLGTDVGSLLATADPTVWILIPS